MIPVLVSVLAAAAVVGPPPRPAAVSGLFSTSHMTVRATVVDRCAVGPAGAVCQGGASIKPLAVDRPSPARVDIVF